MSAEAPPRTPLEELTELPRAGEEGLLSLPKNPLLLSALGALVSQKWKVNVSFRGACRLPGTGIVECLEITDAGCNVKQFDGLT